jgi:alpha-tubulin suppressor-like RCC1 family protein
MKDVVITIFAISIILGCGGGKKEGPDMGVVRGRVVDDDGMPMSGVKVEMDQITISAETGDDGRFELSGVPEGAFDMRFSKDGYVTSRRSVVISGGEAKDIGDVTIFLGGWVKGSVEVPDGMGLYGISVSIKEMPEISPFKLEGDGEFTISGIPPGEYTLVIDGGWRYERVEIGIKVEKGEVTEIPPVSMRFTFRGIGMGSTISAKASHSLALCSDGTVWAWGNNSDGQLGDGTTVDRTVPVQVEDLRDVVAISAGWGHSLALRSDGTVWAWGDNGYGQLGDGTTINHTVPVQVKGLRDVFAISGGAWHSLALRSDGTVWAWGYNGYGQLGDGTTVDRTVPVQVKGLRDVVAISAGWRHSLALRSDGTVWAWGDNKCGMLRPDGTPWGPWVDHGCGELGIGTAIANSAIPVQVQWLNDVIAISAGDWYSLALRSDGTVWGWGWNGNRQLGDGTNISRNSPVRTDLRDVVAISAGAHHSLALRSDGTVWGWGDNGSGQLGNGKVSSRSIFVQAEGLSDVVAISTGSDHSLALRSDGTVWAWGWNKSGQLGDGTTTDRYSPVQVKGLGSVMMPRK